MKASNEFVTEIETFILKIKLLSLKFKIEYLNFDNIENQILHKGFLVLSIGKWEYLIKKLIKYEFFNCKNMLDSSHQWNCIEVETMFSLLKIDQGTVPYPALIRVDKFLGTNYTSKIKQHELDKIYSIRNRISHGEDFVLSIQEFDEFLGLFEAIVYEFIQ